MTGIEIIFVIIILIFSVVIHEVAHGNVANQLGDPTAKYAGRLTLNPLAHLDPVGSLLVPLFLFMVTGGRFVFAMAKPVPINPFNFRDKKFGEVRVAIAGATANFVLALIFGLIIRFTPGYVGPIGSAIYVMFQWVVFINLLLAVFNLVPIPPLDGSHVLFAFLPASQTEFKLFLQRWGLFILLFFIFFLSRFLFPIIQFLYQLIVGAPLMIM
jgi:Zn-dependent protease